MRSENTLFSEVVVVVVTLLWCVFLWLSFFRCSLLWLSLFGLSLMWLSLSHLYSPLLQSISWHLYLLVSSSCCCRLPCHRHHHHDNYLPIHKERFGELDIPQRGRRQGGHKNRRTNRQYIQQKLCDPCVQYFSQYFLKTLCSH